MSSTDKPLVWLHGDVFAKKDRKTPKLVVDTCKERLKRYDAA